MRKIKLIIIVFILLSISSNAQNKFSIYASVNVKKSIVYDGIQINNTDHFALNSKMTPVLNIWIDKPLKNKIGLTCGFGFTFNNLHHDFTYQTDHFNYTEKLKLNIFSIKFPINFYYKPKKNFAILFGFSPNYFSYYSRKTIGEYNGSYTSVSSSYYVPFENKYTFSTQLGSNYFISDKSAINFHMDFDFGKYPPLIATIESKNLMTNEKEIFSYKANPRLMYFALGYSYKIW